MNQALSSSATWCIDPWPHMDALEALGKMDASPPDVPVQAAPLPRGMLNEITTFDESSRVALIDFSGVVGRNLPQWALRHGYTDTALLVSGLDALAALNPLAVLLHLDTPGGLYNGTPEAAARIAEFTHFTAPVHAYTEGQCLCLGMWLASACSSFMASPSAYVGGIGAYSIQTDSSAAWGLAGLKKHLITSGPLKGMGESGTPLTPRQLSNAQERVDEIGDLFKVHILNRWRNASPRILQGGVVQAQSADGRTVHHGIQATKNRHARLVLDQVLKR